MGVKSYLKRDYDKSPDRDDIENKANQKPRLIFGRKLSTLQGQYPGSGTKF
jgi:hypothetical protein